MYFFNQPTYMLTIKLASSISTYTISLLERFNKEFIRLLGFALGIKVKILFCPLERSRKATKKIGSKSPPNVQL